MNEERGELSVDNIIEIHDYAIKRWGGLPGIRDKATLEYLIYSVRHEEDPISQTALIIYTISTHHPFMDGNKRTAFLVADNQFALSGYTIDTSNEEIYQFILMVADNQKTLKEVKKWVRRYMRSR